MNICFVGYSFAGSAGQFRVQGSRRIGGAEVFLYDQCRLLMRHGYTPTVIQGGLENTRFDLDGISVRQVKSSGRYDFNLKWRKAVPGDASHVHLHDANHSFPFAGAQETATFHGVQWDLPFAGSVLSYARWAARRRFFKHLARWAVKNVREIVSVDTFLLRYVQSEMPNYRDKISVIPNYVDRLKFFPRKAIPNKRKVILFPRNLTRSRGTRLILEAFGSLARTDAELWVTGTGPELPAVLAAAKKNPRIIHLGHKDHYSEMPQVFRQADIVVIPSLGVEGTSLSCLEALACGKPVIASDVGGLIDIIEDGKNGVLSHATAKDFAASIASLLDDDRTARRLGKAARQRASEFSYERWAESWLAFFEGTTRRAKA